MSINDKKKVLQDIIGNCESILVSFSGGVDSTLLAVIANDVLGEKSRAVLFNSPLVPGAAVQEAKQTAACHGITLHIIDVPHMEHDLIRKNPPDRCYHCKKISTTYLKQMAEKYGLRCIADGINISDMSEHRPGLVAATEEGIIHPFILAGITKDDIREIARDRGLIVWHKPSAACLASRIPYGDEITLTNLRMIEQAEALLAEKGFIQFRVRLHGRLARIEVNPADFEKLLVIREDLIHRFKGIGFSYITLDLTGYRSGSMDEVL